MKELSVLAPLIVNTFVAKSQRVSSVSDPPALLWRIGALRGTVTLIRPITLLLQLCHLRRLAFNRYQLSVINYTALRHSLKV